MGWSLGHDARWGKFGRDIGYGVPAVCDQPGCTKRIDRGLSYVCGSEPYGGDHGCGLFFCGRHMTVEERGEDCPQLCERCASGELPFDPKPDVAAWLRWKLKDKSWAQWRSENAEEVALMNERLKASQTRPADASEGANAPNHPNPSNHTTTQGEEG